ncbi:MAG: sulfotransferase domain-containing protein [Anaerolineae bacterium]
MTQTHKPNFFLLGAAKSGSTSLYYYLSQHAEVCFSDPKEPRFFEKEYIQGMDFYWQTYFKGWQGQPLIGDASQRNLFLPYVPPRIHAQCPEAKLIVLLRNPIDRAFSDWWMNYSLGIEKLPFEKAIAANLEQLRSGFSFAGEDGEALWREAMHWGGAHRYVKYRWYLEMGYYAEQLQRYLALFPDTQLQVLFFEELKAPLELVNRALTFLGASYPLQNLDTTPQMVGIPSAGRPVLRVARALRIQHLIPKPVRNTILSYLQRYSHKPQMSAAMRAWLVEHYHPHNRQLEMLTNKSLVHWDN